MSLVVDSYRDDDAQWMFPRQTLRLTEQLLRASYPALARRIHHALTLGSMHRTQPHAFNYASLTYTLDALIITQIIAALTEIGRQWVAHPEDHPASFQSLEGLLHQWIDLGDWILCHSDLKT